MRWRQSGFRKISYIAIVAVNLLILCAPISPVSGYIYAGAELEFEYLDFESFHHYLRFEVLEWDSIQGYCEIRVTNETGYQDYRLKIPEWSIIDEEGSVIGMWPYCPLWVDTTSMFEGMVFDDPDFWLFNFTVDRLSSYTCEIERIIPGDLFDYIEHLYYNGLSGHALDSERIRQWDNSTRTHQGRVYMRRLKYLEDGWPSSITDPPPEESFDFQQLLVLGIAVELIVISILALRIRSRRRIE